MDLILGTSNPYFRGYKVANKRQSSHLVDRLTALHELSITVNSSSSVYGFAETSVTHIPDGVFLCLRDNEKLLLKVSCPQETGKRHE